MARTGTLFRAAQPGDLEHLLAVADTSPGAPRWSSATWREVLESPQTSAQRVVLLAESVNECVGFGVVSVAADGAEVESLAVAALWRRRGIARQLCAELLSWARARSAKHVSLEVRVSNVAARALYEGLGFQQIALRRRYYRDPEEDALVMTTDL